MPRITSGTFAGPAGPLEFIFNQPEPGECSGVIDRVGLVCHPHPLHGGTMNTRIVFHASQALGGLGMPVLRFNFRGVGRSAGSYDRGEGEQSDLRAALAYLNQLYPVPVVLAGFSFGATMVVKYLARGASPEIERVVLMGLPVGQGELPQRWVWNGPKLLISGDRDEFAPVAALESYYAGLAEPKRRVWLPGGDHFIAGQMEEFRATLRRELDFERVRSPAPMAAPA